MKKILGISAYYHDSAAALIIGGEIVAAAQEERFSRVKHDESFPIRAIEYCLKEGGVSVAELDAVVFYEKPFLKFERLLETYKRSAPKGIRSFLRSMPVWLKEKLFLKRMLREGLKQLPGYQKDRVRLLFSEHHLSHAAATFYTSNFEEAAILTIDGVGEWQTATIGIGSGRNIELLEEMNFPDSLGLLYSSFTYFLGFKVNSGEYKLMGLAPYGNRDADQTKEYIDLIHDNLIHLSEDGAIELNQRYFSYQTSLRMVPDLKWEQLFGFKKRLAQDNIEQHHCNLAMAIQEVTEEIVLKMARHVRELTNQSKLCLSGGVALNCVANGALHREGLFEEIYIQPAAGDAGGALGAALATDHLYFENERVVKPKFNPYLGPDYNEEEILNVEKKYGAKSLRLETSELTRCIAEQLAKDKVVGWFQGRMEFGPRALGHRSILAAPVSPGMQRKLNLKIKGREGFRPFAPIVLAEDAKEFFDLKTESPYMLLVGKVLDRHRKEESKQSVGLNHEFDKSVIPAVTHVDYSARIQTVSVDYDELLYSLLIDYKRISGLGVLVNTSFNVRGEPIVCTPEDAYQCFMQTDMDILVLNDYVYYKSDQPDCDNKKRWVRMFKED